MDIEGTPRINVGEMINRTNEQYRDKHLALIQKVPTPITRSK